MNLRNLALGLLIVAGTLMTYLIYDINQTENSLAQSLTEKPMENAEIHLNAFFDPVENILLTARGHARAGQFDSVSHKVMNDYFPPLIQSFPQVSSMGIAHTGGFEYDVIPKDDGWDHRILWIDGWGKNEKWQNWKFDSTTGIWKLTNAWSDQVKNDPRDRPWFKGALETSGREIHWTDPYLYNTTFEVGMTASLQWNRPKDSLKHIMAFDLTLSDITQFTQNLNVSENGKVFILSENGKYIGLPEDESLKSKEDIKEGLLKTPDEIEVVEVSDFYSMWMNELNQSDRAHEFESNGQYWWGKIVRYQISEQKQFLVGVLVPEEDILSDLQHSKRIIIGSFAFVLVLTAFLLYSYSQTRKANAALTVKNEEISHQKQIIEEKNRDIVSSIHYAKRLQDAILPGIKVIQSYLPKTFVYYRPKDVVAGDFYWMEKVDDIVYLAAADCTGHGVPGAMVSFVCSNALSKALVEEGVKDVGQLLDRTRELVINRFGKSDHQIKDGMDISLIAINLKDMSAQWAGANNPLWIIRSDSDEVEEIKANKQPVGKYAQNKPFNTHSVQFNEGDSCYMFSDGFPDQFGGKKGKKYKSKAFKRFLVSIQSKEMKAQEKALNKEFDRWKADMEQIDDLVVIGVRF